MSQAVKRISKSSVNWQKLIDRLTPQHNVELIRLKGQNSTYSAQVNELPADLPKIDFAALKKAMPTHSAVLDSLQKQYEAISIPYGTVPNEYNADIDKWIVYNQARIKLNELKAADGAIEAKKVEDKWAKAPPVEHMHRQHFAEYFSDRFTGECFDLRYQKRIPDIAQDGWNNSPEGRAEQEHMFNDYNWQMHSQKKIGH